MHPIQQYILRQLMRLGQCRFSQLKPEDVESNLFVYHFRKLLGQELVAKLPDGSYVLTPEGKRHASKMSVSKMQYRQQPVIATFIGCQNEKGEWLLHRRAYQPFLGKMSLPYGKLHWGENLVEAGNRELREKAGLTCELEHRGDIYLRVYEGEELVNHMLCHVFYGKNPTGELKEGGERGDCTWEVVQDPTSSTYLPGFADIFALVQRTDHPQETQDVVVRMPVEYEIPGLSEAEVEE